MASRQLDRSDLASEHALGAVRAIDEYGILRASVRYASLAQAQPIERRGDPRQLDKLFKALAAATLSTTGKPAQ
ncbi:MAG: hypothetical protein ACRDK2_07595 [Solirubrobacteraceae bacterium]